MPELPEVETIRQDLLKKILNTKIVQVRVYNSKSVGGESTKFVRMLVGATFCDIERRGKLLVFRIKNSPQSVLSHLKMTGQLIYERKRKGRVEIVAGGHKMSEGDIDGLPNKHTRFAFVFANGGDRKNITDIPEGAVCQKYAIKMVFNVGKGGKVQSSSWLVAAAQKHVKGK